MVHFAEKFLERVGIGMLLSDGRLDIIKLETDERIINIAASVQTG